MLSFDVLHDFLSILSQEDICINMTSTAKELMFVAIGFCTGNEWFGELEIIMDLSSDWQPIETAPKDGTVVDLWITFGNRGQRHNKCHFDEDEWVEWSCFDQLYISVLADYNNAEVTHWMPRSGD